MKIVVPAIIVASMVYSPLSFSNNSPWIPTPESLNINVSHTFQTADEFYFGDEKRQLPEDLELSTTAISINYGINDYLALDAKIGYAESDFDGAPKSSLSGITDSTIGLTWQLINEYASEGNVPSVTARLGLIIEGDYETGAINAIGDGGSGVEVSVAVGKSLNSLFAVSGDIGYRDRTNNIPSEINYGASVYFTPTAKFSSFLSYRVDDARDGFDIGGKGFSPKKFPEVEEDKSYVQLGGQYAFTSKTSVGLSYATVTDGRNTSISDVYSLNVNHTF